MSRKTKTEQVVRRVVLGREYKIFSMTFKDNQPSMDLVETITSDKRPNESELAKKYKVDKVVIIATKVITGYYGVSIEEFMKLATLVEKKEKSLSEDKEEEPENTEESEEN